MELRRFKIGNLVIYRGEKTRVVAFTDRYNSVGNHSERGQEYVVEYTVGWGRYNSHMVLKEHLSNLSPDKKYHYAYHHELSLLNIHYEIW